MILAGDFEKLREVANLSIETPRYGGHCGFIKNTRLDSWIDERMLALVESCRNAPSKPRAQQPQHSV